MTKGWRTMNAIEALRELIHTVDCHIANQVVGRPNLLQKAVNKAREALSAPPSEGCGEITVRDGQWRQTKITCVQFAEWIADQAINDRSGLIQRVAEALVADRAVTRQRALAHAATTPTGWKLVPIEMVDEMRKAWFAELERWGTRRNKGEKLPYEVYRHSSDEVVSPVVMERFAVEDDAERCQFRLETAAAYRAMLAAAPAPTEGERG